MRLSARVILNYANVNNFSYGNQWIVRAGDPNTLYFQLVDLDQSPSAIIGGPNLFNSGGTQVFNSSIGLRYMAGIGVSNQPFSVSVTFPSIDSATMITLNATQADPADSSIWKVSIPSSAQINAGNVQFSVAEGSAIRKFGVTNLLNVEFPNNGSC